MLTTALLLCGAILATPLLIRALPDRYVFRLPEPLQKYGLPENEVSLLPTVEAPVAAVSLLAARAEASSTAAATGTAVATATTKGTMVESKPIASAELPPAAATATSTRIAAPTAAPTETPWPLPQTKRMLGFEHKFQTWNNCGPATLAMALTYYGEQVSQNETASFLKPNAEDRNVSPQEMAAYVNEQTPYRALTRANGSTEILKRLLANDLPVIIETGIDPPGEFRWLGWYGHYLLAVAYNEEAQQFWVYDSWLGTSEEPLQNAHPDGRALTYELLDTNWQQFNRSYIVLFKPEQEALVAELIGADSEDAAMWTGALTRAKAETEADPQNAFNWFNLGTNYVALDQYEEAAIAFDQARALGLPWRMLWYQFGPYAAYQETGRYEDVLALAEATLKDRPYFEESYYYKALALEALGEQEAARENMEKAADFNPNFSAAVSALAEFER